MKYDTIVIGGGLAGLTAGATLSKFGRKVLLLEKHYKPGGCATTFKRKDFIVEVGLHEMSGLAKNSVLDGIFEMLEVKKNVEFLTVPEFYGVLSDEEDFVCPHGYEAMAKAFIEKYPEEKKGIDHFVKLMAGLREEIPKLPRSPIKRKLIYPLMPLLFPSLVETSGHTVGSWLDKHFTNENAKLDLVAHIAYWGDDPYNLSMFYFTMPFSGFIQEGGRFIKGGSQQLSDHLAEFIEKHGGKVLLGKKAEKINTRNGRVNAVTFSDCHNPGLEKETIECDNVIANCAIPLIPDMLEEPYATSLSGKIGSKTNSCSLLCIYLGFNRDIQDLGVKYYSNFFKGTGINSIKDIYPNNKGDWSERSFIFVDYNKVDSELAPDHKAAGVICAVDYLDQWKGLSKKEYINKKMEVSEILLSRLEKRFPGITESIEYSEVSTPKTVQDYTWNPGGSVYGFAQSKDQAADKRFRNNFLIPNLYFSSAWAFPGGGFEGSMMGGFLAAIQMNQDKIWSNSNQVNYKDERVVSFVHSKKINEKTLELTFEKPIGFEQERRQAAILRLLEPEFTELDLPYRQLSTKANKEGNYLKFNVRMDDSSFSKSCAKLKAGDHAIIFGPNF